MVRGYYAPEPVSPVDMDQGFSPAPYQGSYPYGQAPQQLSGPADVTPKITWTNRRRMAWVAFFALFAAAAVALYCGLWVARSDRQIAFVETLYSYLAISCAAVILGYMGFTSLPFLGRAK